MTEKRTPARPTVLAIIGSARKLGNCELFVKAVSEKIPVEHDLRLIRLPALNIRPCTGCYRCLNDGTCWIEDDIPFIIEQVVSADALIIASPVYFLGTHGSVKALLDRAFAFFSALDSTARKPCLLVNAYGMKDRVGVAPQTLLTLSSFLGLEVKANINLMAALPGEWLGMKAPGRTAARVAGLLFGTKGRKRESRSCPFCGNDIVRMRKEDFLCTVCNGSFSLDGQGRAVKGQAGWDVGSMEFVRSHREWLKGMKQRFLATRKELLALALPYKDMGEWVEPAPRPVGKEDDGP
jgi:multimeric flavodoxin WrbA